LQATIGKKVEDEKLDNGGFNAVTLDSIKS